MQQPMPQNMGSRIATAASWTVIARVAVRAIGLISTPILARLLTPSDFGLLALVMAFVVSLTLLSEFDFDLWLIRRENPTPSDYDSVWTLNILRALLLGAIVFACAPLWADLFGDERLTPVLRLLAIAYAIEGFTNSGIVDFRRNLQLHREFLYLIWTKIISFAVTITAAIILQNYWALAIGVATQRMSLVLMSFVLHPYRPGLSLASAREMLSFSKWLLAKNALDLIRRQGDIFFVGKIAPINVVGTYNVAKEVSGLPLSQIIDPMSRALYPGYAKLKDNAKVLRETYVSSFAIILLIAFPLAAFMVASAKPFIAVLLGPEWDAAVPLFQILVGYALLRVPFTNAEALLLARQGPRALAIIAVFNVCVLLALLLPGTLMAGATGAAFALIGATFLTLCLLMARVAKLLGISPFGLVTAAWRTIAASAVAILPAQKLLKTFPQADGLIENLALLTACFAATATTFVVTALVLWVVSGRPAGPERDALGWLGSLIALVRANLPTMLRRQTSTT